MKITVDTNILVRAVVRDEERQAEAAAKLLKKAEIIAVALPVRVRMGAAACLRFYTAGYFRCP
jgi:predicted nucleic acid-binding protein